MSRLSRLRLALFGLALLFGQLLQVAHAYEHKALSVHPVCQVCIHGQGLDSGALAPSALALPTEFGAQAAIEQALPSAVSTLRASAHRSRGPPVILV
uniref:Uncharacterized protein n=1 Tax=uncultured bacterium 50 TaxID=1748278 RepID=A0A0U3UA91_9BACT|nr:hypothetical protein [uncultured bacterium 50]